MKVCCKCLFTSGVGKSHQYNTENADKFQFAKLEHVILTAIFLASFDYELCNDRGVTVTKLPDFDRERPVIGDPGVPLYMKYTRRRD